MSVLQYDTASGDPGAVLPIGGDDAGYISGRFDNYQAIRATRPRAIVLPICTIIPTLELLQGLRQVAFDFESGDLAPGQATACIDIAHQAGIPSPIAYGSVDTWIAAGGLDEQLAGLTRGVAYQGWLARPDAIPTIPAGFAAKQYLFGPEFDTSIIADPQTFYNLPHSPPQPPGDTKMVAPYETADRRTGFVVETSSGEILHIEQQNAPGSGANTDFWRDDKGQPNWLSLGTPGS